MDINYLITIAVIPFSLFQGESFITTTYSLHHYLFLNVRRDQSGRCAPQSPSESAAFQFELLFEESKI